MVAGPGTMGVHSIERLSITVVKFTTVLPVIPVINAPAGQVRGTTVVGVFPEEKAVELNVPLRLAFPNAPNTRLSQSTEAPPNPVAKVPSLTCRPIAAASAGHVIVYGPPPFPPTLAVSCTAPIAWAVGP